MLASSTAPAPPFTAQRNHHARPFVFLAEDDSDLRRMVAEALRDAGFDVLSASTGHEMLKLLTSASRGEVPTPDAIVMDIRMPRCSGIDVLRALRLAEWHQPVVMMTAFGDPEIHERAASYGASVVLDKPFDAEDLVGMLDVLLHVPPSDGEASRRADPDDDEPEPTTLRSP